MIGSMRLLPDFTPPGNRLYVFSLGKNRRNQDGR
jgi:hypothetical protein